MGEKGLDCLARLESVHAANETHLQWRVVVVAQELRAVFALWQFQLVQLVS